ncbi:MAG: ATPase [Cellulomonas sp. 73-145]|uniref:SRPBCC domain-containing protein n=1 Tax=Cellulomonas sp. 73-145 TaxID=1895739 RepID=UPI000926C9F8|nr:SRPBCC domain-containing protein [Cellulomonas sp. 73-145]OJV58778.1 MAG: ATPase [Cellulomonas sp. 73-145]
MDHVARAEVLIGAPAERVWDVLTSPEPRPEIMFGARTVSDWQPGHPITWSGQWEGHPFEDKGEVLEVERPRRLVVTHFSPMSGQPDVPESYHRLQYVLEPVDGGTRVVLEQDNNPTAESAEHSAANWRAMLDGLKTVSEAPGA